jgi:hypothetical protein
MNAALNTHSEQHCLFMKNIELFDDGSGGACFLEVMSFPFSAATQFFFDQPSLDEFVAALESLDAKLVGEAKLGQQFEEPFFSLRRNGRGQIIVSGVLAIFAEHSQRLEFEFVTDQTVLSSFISDLKAICDADAT